MRGDAIIFGLSVGVGVGVIGAIIFFAGPVIRDAHSYSLIRECNNDLMIAHYAWERDDGTFWYGTNGSKYLLDKDHLNEVCRP